MKGNDGFSAEDGQDAVEYALLTGLFAALAAVISQLNAVVDSVLRFVHSLGLA